MNTFWHDVKYACRTLAKSPGFTVVALLTLALGIGANTAIFSVVNGILLRPLPYDHPDRLVTLWEFNLPRERPRNVVSPGNFQEWRDQARSFERMAAFSDWTYNLTGDGEPERVPGRATSPDIFLLLGVTPALGRIFAPGDEAAGSERVVVVSHGLWQRRFGGDAEILGHPIRLDGRSYTIVGVLPPSFEFFGEPADVWTPLLLPRGEEAFQGRWLQVLARLKPGVSLQAAKAELVAIAARLRQAHPDANAGWSANVVGLKETVVGSVEQALEVLVGAVGFLLLIACANVANLLLARAAAREKEMAIRSSLGASGSRLLRQVLTECLCLSVLAALAGVLLAVWGVGLIRDLLPSDLRVPGIDRIGVDLPVLGFTSLVAIAAGLLFGTAPALFAARDNFREPLHGAGRSSPSRQRSTIRQMLVVTEVSLALVLLLGAGLLLRSFSTLRRVDPGFQIDHLLTVRISLPDAKYSTDPRQAAFFTQLTERLAALPEVQAVGAISFLPLSGLRSASGFTVEGRPSPAPGEEPVGDMRAVSPGYFAAMGIPLRRGRGLAAADGARAPSVAVISETLARQLFPGEDPIGQRLSYDWGYHVSAEIVGVAGDVHHSGLGAEPHMEIYRPLEQFPYSFMHLVIRSQGDPAALSRQVRAEVHALDPEQPVDALRPVGELVARSLAQPRLNALLLGLFAAVGLLLAAVGIYGVMAYGVTQRTQEIGIRMALGADPGNILGLVLRHGLRLTLAGMAIGLVTALALARAMTGLLYGISSRDPETFAGIPLVLAIVALIACYVPARRATRVDPIVALKSE